MRERNVEEKKLQQKTFVEDDEKSDFVFSHANNDLMTPASIIVDSAEALL